MPVALGLLLLLLVLSPAGTLQPGLEPPNLDATEAGAVLFADAYNSTAEIVLFKSVSASWDYYTNLTDTNGALQVGAGTGCCRGGSGRVGRAGGVPFLPTGSFRSTPRCCPGTRMHSLGTVLPPDLALRRAPAPVQQPWPRSRAWVYF